MPSNPRLKDSIPLGLAPGAAPEPRGASRRSAKPRFGRRTLRRFAPRRRRKPNRLFEIIFRRRWKRGKCGGNRERREPRETHSSFCLKVIPASREANQSHLLASDYSARSHRLLWLLDILNHTPSDKVTIRPDFEGLGRHESLYSAEWPLLCRQI